MKLTQATGDQVLVSQASAIDLAGSEDNRRTDNDKQRLIESSAINKSLFVLAQCVEAISKKQARVPYRESKMTRILSLGQNNGFTLMILNLAPVRSYHLDTLSSLNFANRTKKIEVNEIENEPFLKGVPAKAMPAMATGPTLARQPLRPLTTHNIQTSAIEVGKKPPKAMREFSVFTDKSRLSGPRTAVAGTMQQKRPLDASYMNSARPTKVLRHAPTAAPGLTVAEIEEMIERRVDAKLAEKALNAPVQAATSLSSEVQQRLDALEQRVAHKEDSEGLQYLLMAKQHQARGEYGSALKMYQLAQPFYPDNEKLGKKIANMQMKMQRQKEQAGLPTSTDPLQQPEHDTFSGPTRRNAACDDDEYQDAAYNDELGADGDDSFVQRAVKPRKRKVITVFQDAASTKDPNAKRQLLEIVNSRDVTQIRSLKGVGAKKAEAIVNALFEMNEGDQENLITDLRQLGALPGFGVKSVETMLVGLGVAV